MGLFFLVKMKATFLCDFLSCCVIFVVEVGERFSYVCTNLVAGFNSAFW